MVVTQESLVPQILHVGGDEKFIDSALRDFDRVAEGISRLVILGAPRTLRHVRYPDVEFCNDEHLMSLVGASGAKALIFHSIPSRIFRRLSKVPSGIRVVWLGWGYDYYERLLADYYPQGFILPKTRLSVSGWAGRRGFDRLGAWVSRVMGRGTGGFSRQVIRGIQRVDIFSPVLDIEFEMANERNSWMEARYQSWNYGTVEDDFGVDDADPARGPAAAPNILVGNSAAEENNHVEVFERLASCGGLAGRKVVVPLSYGNARHGRQMVKLGRRLLGDNFHPLTGFLPPADYRRVVQSCGVVIMNHLRQQGLGNICIAMLAGSRVFLNPVNPLYSWFRRRGGVVDSVDAIASSDSHSLFAPLPASVQTVNAAMIRGHWGREHALERTRQLIRAALAPY